MVKSSELLTEIARTVTKISNLSPTHSVTNIEVNQDIPYLLIHDTPNFTKNSFPISFIICFDPYFSFSTSTEFVSKFFDQSGYDIAIEHQMVVVGIERCLDVEN